MAISNDENDKNHLKNFPKVLVLKPPKVFRFFEDEFKKIFHLLSAWESQLPLDEFLATHARSVQEMICSRVGPHITADILQLIPSLKLGGKRVGFVGLGKIGILVAKRLEPFGCSISYNSRKKKDFVSYPFYSNVGDLAANSDALVICCGLTEQTRHMVNKEVLLALGKEGVIINVGRGAIINEKDLVQCLVDGKIGGAGLDVFKNEPDVPKEFFTMDNVVLSPHSSVCTPESFKDSCETAIGNLEAFFSRKPLLSPIMDE